MPIGYVSPQGVITLYKGVPLNPTYNDVLYIPSPESSYSYFTQYIYETLNENTYSRVNNENKIRVGITAEKLYLCNYLSWSNHGFGTTAMNFFAFITNVEYINNSCTEITYVIDDMTTWFPYLQLKECYVERETPATDNLYEHLEPENIALGDYVENGSAIDVDLGDTKVLFMASTDVNGDRREGDESFANLSWVNGIKSALCYAIYDCKSKQDMENLYQLINDYSNNGQAENIIAIMLVPEFVTEHIREQNFGNAYAVKTFEVTQSDLLDGYQPKNKKLYSYPFSKLILSNKSGGTKDYKYENFLGENGKASFVVTGCCFGTPTVMAEPELYLNHVGDDCDQSLMLTNFAQAPCFNDTYRAYMAQNKNAIGSQSALSLLGSAVSIATGVGIIAATGGVGTAPAMALMAGTGAIGSGVVGATSAIAKPIAQEADAKNLPITISGLVQADAINAIRNITGIQAKRMSVRKEYARMIDEYFSAYGYACGRIKKPNIMARNIWNFVKTQQCCVTGSAPAPAISNICNIFDRGVRFWKNPADIGNYQGNN